MMVNAKNNFNLFLKEMIGATSCDFFIYNLVENNTLVDDWSLMIMWLMLEIESILIEAFATEPLGNLHN